MSIKHTSQSSQPLHKPDYKPLNENNARNVRLSNDFTGEPKEVVLSYLKEGYNAYLRETNAENKAGLAGLAVVKSIFKARLYYSTFNKKMDEKGFRKHIILHLFKINADIRTHPQKSSIYAKIKAALKLIELNHDTIKESNIIGTPAAAIAELADSIFTNYESLRGLYDALKPEKQPKPSTSDESDSETETENSPESDSETGTENSPESVQLPPEVVLMQAASDFITAFNNVVKIYGYSEAVTMAGDVVEVITQAYQKIQTTEKLAA